MNQTSSEFNENPKEFQIGDIFYNKDGQRRLYLVSYKDDVVIHITELAPHAFTECFCLLEDFIKYFGPVVKVEHSKSYSEFINSPETKKKIQDIIDLVEDYRIN